MRAFLFGFAKMGSLIRWLVVGAGLCLIAYSWVDNKLNYTEVSADVLRLETVCKQSGKKNYCRQGVHVTYRSPADGLVHESFVAPIGGHNAVLVAKLKPGDRWKVLAHDDKPDVVKVD